MRPGDTSIDLNNMTQAEAQELISEDGYWGVEQTSNRIVEMARQQWVAMTLKNLLRLKLALKRVLKWRRRPWGAACLIFPWTPLMLLMEKLDQWAEGFKIG